MVLVNTRTWMVTSMMVSGVMVDDMALGPTSTSLPVVTTTDSGRTDVSLATESLSTLITSTTDDLRTTRSVCFLWRRQARDWGCAPPKMSLSPHPETYFDSFLAINWAYRCFFSSRLFVICLCFVITRTWLRYVRVFALTIPSVCRLSVCLSSVTGWGGAKYPENVT